MRSKDIGAFVSLVKNNNFLGFLLQLLSGKPFSGRLVLNVPTVLC